MSTVIGIDLSLTSPAIALVRNGEFEDYCNPKSKGTKKDTLSDRARRLDRLSQELIAFIHSTRAECFEIDLAVIESPSFGSRHGSAHDRSGLWWLIVDYLHRNKIPVAMVSPAARAKYITGNGRSDKDVVLAHAIERYVVLDGPRIPNDDVADAVGLADMGARRVGQPVPCDMPEANLAAMNGVAWPTT